MREFFLFGYTLGFKILLIVLFLHSYYTFASHNHDGRMASPPSNQFLRRQLPLIHMNNFPKTKHLLAKINEWNNQMHSSIRINPSLGQDGNKKMPLPLIWKKKNWSHNIMIQKSSVMTLISTAAAAAAWFCFPKQVHAKEEPINGGGITATTTHHEKMRPDEVIGRAFAFWKKSGPIICHYRFTQLWVSTIKQYDRERRDDIYQELHERYAPHVLNIILDMKGLFIKIGQVLSSRPDFVPKEYIDLLCSVQDTIPVSYSADKVRDILQHSFQTYLGLNVEDVFESVDYDDALGNASIGQVHKATLKNTLVNIGDYTGTKNVAVKLMHSDAKDRFYHDFQIFKWLCRVALPGWKPILVEVERQMMTEFDYIREADNLHTVRNNISKSPYANQVVIPEPVLSLCTKNVLIMELLHGTKLADATEKKLSTILNGNTQMARRLIHDKRKELFEGAPMIDKGTLMQSYKDLCQGQQMSYWKQLMMAINLYSFAKKQEQTLDLLMDVHGHQIFVDGCFNGDPHPGNILELEDGRLGLIDYGQCKRLKESERLSLARIVSKLKYDVNDGMNDPTNDNNFDNEKIVADAMRDFGFRFKNQDENHIVTRTARLFFDSDIEGKQLGLATPQLYLLYLQARNPMEHVPDAAVMVARTSFLFRGMGALFGKQLETSKRWAKHAQQALEKHTSENVMS